MILSEVSIEQIRPGFTIVKSATGNKLGIVARVSDKKVGHRDGDDYLIEISWGSIHEDGKPDMSEQPQFSLNKIEILFL